MESANLLDSHSLLSRLCAKIQQGGPISFARFMESALYDTQGGYYAADRARIGGKGADFFTGVTSGSVLGRVLAAQFAEIWQRLDSPRSLSLIEHGAHTGLLLKDVLEESRDHYPDFFQSLQPQIVEPFQPLRKKQEATLEGFSIQWLTTAPLPYQDSAIHFGNELIDAFPVHLLQWDGKQWLEQKVGYREDHLEFVSMPLEDSILIDMIKDWPPPPVAPFFAEVCPAAIAWMESISKSFSQGAILLIDYGWERSDFFVPHRKEGTLRAYANHKLCDDVLTSPGEIDLTAHVDFTALRQAAERVELEQIGWTDQSHFLVGAGEGFLRRLETASASTQKQQLLANFSHLIHPETMGRAFKVALYARGLDKTPSLSGFRFGHR